jgi:putative addiction module component (TIGR02574 family)
MAPTLESLGIDKLSLDEKSDLICAIWDDLVRNDKPSISDSQIAELEQRYLNDERGLYKHISMEEVDLHEPV